LHEKRIPMGCVFCMQEAQPGLEGSRLLASGSVVARPRSPGPRATSRAPAGPRRFSSSRLRLGRRKAEVPRTSCDVSRFCMQEALGCFATFLAKRAPPERSNVSRSRLWLAPCWLRSNRRKYCSLCDLRLFYFCDSAESVSYSIPAARISSIIANICVLLPLPPSPVGECRRLSPYEHLLRRFFRKNRR